MLSVKISKADFNRICRICLTENQDLISIFNNNLCVLLKTFTDINAQMDDELPKALCKICAEKTYECIKFKQKCDGSERLLYKILKGDYDSYSSSVDNQYLNIDIVRGLEINKNNLQEAKIELKSENKENVIDEKCVEELVDNDCNFDNSIKSEDNTDNSELDFKLPADGKKLSLRRNRINWVMSLGTEKCDISRLLCKICDKSLVNLSSLARHMETHDTNRKFLIMCSICQKGFYEKGNFTKHMQRHKREMKYKCNICPKSFYELNVLALHLRKVHDAKPISCEKCSKQFLVQDQLEIHMKKHANEFPHKCYKCGKGYYLLQRLKEHMLTHKKKYICAICNKIYKNYTSLKSHNDRYHRSLQKKQDCQVCGKTVLHLKQHMMIHNADRTFKCSTCFKTFYRRCDLVAHMKRKHETSAKPIEKPYLCNICGKGKLSNSALQQHIIHAHTNEKTQKCHLCDKAFKTDNALKGHIRYSHKDVRNYKCNVCAKGFYTNVILKNHLRTHTGERPYVCHICNRAFVQSSTLRTHMKIHAKADNDN